MNVSEFIQNNKKVIGIVSLLIMMIDLEYTRSLI